MGHMDLKPETHHCQRLATVYTCENWNLRLRKSADRIGADLEGLSRTTFQFIKQVPATHMHIFASCSISSMNSEDCAVVAEALL